LTNPRHEIAETAFTEIASAGQVSRQRSPEAAGNRNIDYISDDELFALFPGRAAALIGSPDSQPFIFLDKPQQEKNP